jgi:hypothetical protein
MQLTSQSGQCESVHWPPGRPFTFLQYSTCVPKADRSLLAKDGPQPAVIAGYFANVLSPAKGAGSTLGASRRPCRGNQ